MKIKYCFLYGLIALSLLGCSSRELRSDKSSSQRERPNVIFFIADDMYPEMFNCLPQGRGKNLTPNLDRLAAEGTIMLNQYVASPVCSPSRYNCLTGRFAGRATNESFLRNTEKNEGQTVIQWNTQITPEDKTIAHFFRDAGYVTGMVGKNHVIEAKGLEKFPDFNADTRAAPIQQKITRNYQRVEDAILANGFDYAGGLYHNNPNFIGVAELAVHNLDWIAEAGLKFIDQNHHKSFFLYFASTVPHGPNSPGRSWNADPRVTAKGILDEPPKVLPARNTIPQRLAAAGLSGKEKENLLWLDDVLGTLLKKLEEYQLLENTIIVFFNDHGQHAKGTLYQGGALSPSIIWKQGGFPCGDSSLARVLNIDFAPTLLDLAGIDYSASKFDGRSFAHILKSQSPHAGRQSLFFELGYARAVIKGNYKYIAVRYPEYAVEWSEEERAAVLERYNEGRRYRNRPIVNTDPAKSFSHLNLIPGGMEAEHESYGRTPAYFESDQLYDLDKDPQETVNLSGDPAYKKIVAEMQEELLTYLTKLPGKFDL